MIKCAICGEKIRAGDSVDNQVIGEDSEGKVIVRTAHLNCSMKQNEITDKLYNTRGLSDGIKKAT